MEKINCWEFKKCKRELGNEFTEINGICPAALTKKVNGAFSGINGGRCCWMIAGTFCDGKVQGTYAKKFKDCKNCDFYKRVTSEELAEFKIIEEIKEKLKK